MMSNHTPPVALPRAPETSSADALIDELDATVMMLGRIFSARHGEMCSESGLNAAQMLAMRVLAELGPTKAGDLAALLGVKAPAASALIDALEKRGYLEREIDADDRRVHLISLTDTGSRELFTAEIERREHMKRYLSVLEEDDVRTLLRVHRTLIEAMTANRI
jgi:DNA-binding MarR family transcriptional regulator